MNNIHITKPLITPAYKNHIDNVVKHYTEIINNTNAEILVIDEDIAKLTETIEKFERVIEMGRNILICKYHDGVFDKNYQNKRNLMI